MDKKIKLINKVIDKELPYQNLTISDKSREEIIGRCLSYTVYDDKNAYSFYTTVVRSSLIWIGTSRQQFLNEFLK